MGLDNPIHLVLLLMIMLLVFGAKRLPEMGRSLGDGLRGFKEAVNPQGPSSIQETTPAAANVLAATAAPATTQEPVNSQIDLTPAA
jgi:sec-independent protein translocase protein TatA